MPPLPKLHAKVDWAVRAGWNFVGGRSVRKEPALLVPDEFLGRQPARTLHEPSLYLAKIDGRIERAADIVEDVGAQDAVLAGERIDGDLRHRGPVCEIEEGPPARRIAVPVHFGRGVEPGGR